MPTMAELKESRWILTKKLDLLFQLKNFSRRNLKDIRRYSAQLKEVEALIEKKQRTTK